jgi:hypothetical protein
LFQANYFSLYFEETKIMNYENENKKPLAEKAIDWVLEKTVMPKKTGFVGNAVRATIKEYGRNWVENIIDKPGLDPKEVDTVGEKISSHEVSSLGESAGKIGYRLLRNCGEYRHYDRAKREAQEYDGDK